MAVVVVLPIAYLTGRFPRSRTGRSAGSLVATGFALPGVVIGFTFVTVALRVDAFSLCGEGFANWQVEVRVGRYGPFLALVGGETRVTLPDDLPPDELRGLASAGRIFGFLSDTIDLRALMLSVLGEQVAAHEIGRQLRGIAEIRVPRRKIRLIPRNNPCFNLDRIAPPCAPPCC